MMTTSRPEGFAMVESTRTFPSDLAQLAPMREFVDAACRRAWAVDADDDTLSQLQVAMQEAATNIIRHAYDGKPGEPIQLTVAADERMARVVLSHFGREFDPKSVPEPSFDGSRFGGFGIYLIERLVDEVAYTHDNDGCNGVLLVKNRPPCDIAKADN
jgi:serine/threonine-protein kinase RsbW